MTIDIICPLYNAEEYIENLHKSLLKQEKVNITNIFYILTESDDNTEEKLIFNNYRYKKIKKEEFSHSLVREKAIYESKSEIVCLISQDIIIENNNWLEKLVEPIIDNRVDASYSRQLTKFNNIEKYTRESNYPKESIIKSKKDIKKLGLNARLLKK